MDEEINIFDYLKVIYRGKWLLVGLVVAAVLVTAVVDNFFREEMYEAKTSIISMEDESGGLAAAISVIPFLKKESQGGSFTRLTLFLESRTFSEYVVEHNKEIKPILLDRLLRRHPKYQIPENEEQANRILAGLLRGSLKTQSGRKGEFFIGSIWTDPESAVRIANICVDELSGFFNQNSISINFQVLDEARSGEVCGSSLKKDIIFSGVGSFFFGVFMLFAVDYLGGLRKEKRA